MPLVAEVAITLDLPFGSVDFSTLDSVISEALRAHRIPVLDVEVEGLRPIDQPVDPTTVGVSPLSPFAPRTPVPLGPPGPFGTRI